MKVEVTIDKHKKLPDGAIPALEQELLRRLSQSYDDCKLTIRRTSNDGLSVLGGADGDKNALSKFCKRRGKARTTGFISLIVMVAALIPEHRIRVSLDAATRFL